MTPTPASASTPTATSTSTMTAPSTTPASVSPAELRERLVAGEELALLDVREQGVHYRGHPFYACSAPLSRLEPMIGDLVPRHDAPVILVDGGDDGLAARAAAKLAQLGYTRVEILEGGCAGWQASGGGECGNGASGRA